MAKIFFSIVFKRVCTLHFHPSDLKNTPSKFNCAFAANLYIFCQLNSYFYDKLKYVLIILVPTLQILNKPLFFHRFSRDWVPLVFWQLRSAHALWLWWFSSFCGQRKDQRLVSYILETEEYNFIFIIMKSFSFVLIDWLGFFWFVWCGQPPSSANQPTYQTQAHDPTPTVETGDNPPIETVELNIQG